MHQYPDGLNEPRRCSQTDVRSHQKPIEIPVYLQLLTLLNELGAAAATGGQLFPYLPAGGPNFFTVPLNSSYLKSWLVENQTAVGKPAPSSGQIREALGAFAANSIVGAASGVRRPMSLRTAWRSRTFDLPPAIVYSLHTRTGRHAAITPDGWSLQPSQTEFIHDPIQQPLPDTIPTLEPHAALASFRKLLRLHAPEHDETWRDLLNWTLAAMRPAKNESFHDYPILNLIGPAGSGKTVTAKLLAQLIDPTSAPVHTIPNTERRLHGLAAGRHLLAFDQPGKINPEKSRYLSRLSTGIASAHSHLQGMLVRPIILTTEDEKESKHLADRVVDVQLPPVDQPLSQEEIWQAFETERPQILGALLTLLSQDFHAKPAYFPNRKTKSQKIEESIPLLLAQNNGQWQGTVTDLVAALNLPITTQALGRYLNQTETLNVVRKKNNKIATVALTL